MPLPVIANAYKVTWVWGDVDVPQPATNTLHFTNIGGTNTAADLYADMNANVTTNMFAVVKDTAVINTVDIIKLDGTSATQSFSTGSPAKWGGNGGVEAILQGAAVISLKSNLRGPRGRNRIYLPWVGEGNQSNGLISSVNLATQATAWDAFQLAMATAGWQLAAVSAAGSVANTVTTMVHRQALCTQRRRARH